MHRRPWALRAGLCLASALCMGNACFPEGGSSDGGGGYVGLGMPAVQVTVDGTHVGPGPATAGAYADLVSLRDQFGQLTQTQLTLHAEATTSYGPARCDLVAARFGRSVQPFGPYTYAVQTPTGDTTPEGTIAPVGPFTVQAGALTLQCGGAECGSLVLKVIDNRHVEGFLTGTLADPTDGQASSVVCSFYVPWRTYQP